MPPDAAGIVVRPATAEDAAGLADLHVRSWRATYRGMLSDAYLDGPIVAERHAFWTARMRAPPAGLVTLIAAEASGTLGLVCALRDHDPRWGSLVDNLHVDPALKRRGIGRLLLRAVGAILVDTDPDRPVHLFVLTANREAAAFYARLGGETVEHMVKTEPDGSALPVSRIAWPTAAGFAALVR